MRSRMKASLRLVVRHARVQQRLFARMSRESKDVKCVLPPLSVISQLGLVDCIAPVAFCLVASALLGDFMGKDRRKANLLAGRSLDEGTRDASEAWNAEPDEWPCPCNVSYVSKQCYDSNDGIIWEEGHLKLGELKM